MQDAILPGSEWPVGRERKPLGLQAVGRTVLMALWHAKRSSGENAGRHRARLLAGLALAVVTANCDGPCGRPPPLQFPDELTAFAEGYSGRCGWASGFFDDFDWTLTLYRNAPVDRRPSDVLVVRAGAVHNKFQCALHLANPSPIDVDCDLVRFDGTVVQHNSFHGTLTLPSESTALASEAVALGRPVRGIMILNGTSAKTDDGWIVKAVNCPIYVGATWAHVQPPPFGCD